MVTALRLVVLLFAPTLALAADDARVTRLEQDVRTLQRDLQSLARQIDELKLQASRPTGEPRDHSPSLPAPSTTAWLDASKWKQLKMGMTELEVIGRLGAPTSIREANGKRELLYAMEIGTSAFLAGRVVLRDRVVAEIRTPTLQ